MLTRHTLFIFALFLTCFLILQACSRSNYPDSVNVGQQLLLVEDKPDFVLSAVGGYSDEGFPKIYTTIDLSKASLIFRTNESDEPVAKIDIIYEIYELKDGERGEMLHRKSLTRPIKGSSDRAIQGFERTRLNETFDAKTGSFQVQASITDDASGKTFARTVTTIIPDYETVQHGITDIAVLGIPRQDTESPFFIGTYDVPSNVDSLSFRFFVTRPDDSDPMFANLRILRFETDDEPARQMSAPNLTNSSIRNRGINYSRYEVKEHQTRYYDTETGAIEVEFTIPMPKQGSYRFDVYITDHEEAEPDDASIFTARDFGIRSPYFPEIATAREMAEPLSYLMNNRQYRNLMEKIDKGEEELQRAVEHFWVSNLESTDLARQVMELYYERVVEANKQFSSFKEGWKTDMGMIYILFGPPWYVDRFGTRITWIYGYDKNDPYRVFQFRQTRIGNEKYPFHHWTLQRQDLYHSVQYQRRQEWLNGFVLDRPFPF